MNTEDRFWSKVNKTNSCWNWIACKINSYGYGCFWFNGKITGAHRVSWKIHFGKIPKGLCICHKCDNPSCVRPSHLFLGTMADNMKDRDNKRRQSKGSNRPYSKLVEKDVEYIKKLLEARLSQRKIASLMRVDQAVICGINTGKYWSHVV